nr:immunoglobulin heavy chain junction region [Mus musculus]MBK4198295.1 immunoglobulin heavy chain junction region [Mus musculus]
CAREGSGLFAYW